MNWVGARWSNLLLNLRESLATTNIVVQSDCDNLRNQLRAFNNCFCGLAWALDDRPGGRDGRWSAFGAGGVSWVGQWCSNTRKLLISCGSGCGRHVTQVGYAVVWRYPSTRHTRNFIEKARGRGFHRKCTAPNGQNCH